MALGLAALFEAGLDEDYDLRIASSAIAEATYNPAKSDLWIRFTDGRAHNYRVDVGTAVGLATARSAGAYFNKYIK